MKYPFVVAKRKSVVIEANDYSNALDRVLYKYRNKFITTTYAKNVAKHQLNMDLSNAVKQAKTQSKTNKGQLIYVILEADEFIVKDFMAVKEKDDVYSIWRDGLKYEDTKTDEPVMVVTKSPEVVKDKTKSKMEKVKTVPKKLAKKVVAKKVAPKKVTQPKVKVEKKKVGASFFFDATQQKQVEAILKKEDLAFNAWANKLVFSKLG